MVIQKINPLEVPPINPSKVLIVDDSKFMRIVLKGILSKEFANLEVIEAENGLEGIKKFKDDKPDIVTMDVRMPEVDGIQALRAIKKIDSDAKVLMLSYVHERGTINEALSHGATDYLEKPFRKESVIESIKKI